MSKNRFDSRYRPDIDGLRAIAVLSVILFHIRESLLPGGFVGVDIFFAISGYLITRNILSEMDLGRFSLVEFYRRRIKRIAPAMLVVVACTLLVAQILMIPQDAEHTARSSLWALLSLGNVYFWLFEDLGYFARDTQEFPLLHLWTLGVEEQFYFIWPILLLVVLRLTYSKWFLPATISLALGSYILGQLLFDWSPSFVYYMIPTRAGELLAGAIIAVIFARRSDLSISTYAANLLGLLGVGLIFGSFILLNQEQVFPGFRAIPPTLGAVLLILIGQNTGNRVSSCLSAAPLVWVGLVSYSAYLWHWPLLAFIRYGFGTVRPAFALFALALTFLLAALTYRFVERPTRRSRSSFLKVATFQYVLPAGALGCFCVLVLVTDGMATRPATQAFEGMRPANSYKYVCQRRRISKAELHDSNCVIGNLSSMSPDALLWGDSNAAHYIGVLGAFAFAADFSFRNIQQGSCPPLLTDPSRFIEARNRADCIASLGAVTPALNASRTLIIAASWTTYQRRDPGFLEEFFRGVKLLISKGKRVILIGKAPIFANYDRKCLQKSSIYPFIDCKFSNVPVAQSVPAINVRIADFAKTTEGVDYFDATQIICPNDLCSPFDGEGQALYFDEQHISMDGSWRIGQSYIKNLGVPPLFASLGGSSEP